MVYNSILITKNFDYNKGRFLSQVMVCRVLRAVRFLGNYSESAEAYVRFYVVGYSGPGRTRCQNLHRHSARDVRNWQQLPAETSCQIICLRALPPFLSFFLCFKCLPCCFFFTTGPLTNNRGNLALLAQCWN